MDKTQMVEYLRQWVDTLTQDNEHHRSVYSDTFYYAQRAYIRGIEEATNEIDEKLT